MLANQDVIFTVDPEEEPPIVKVKGAEIPPKKLVILTIEVVNDDEDIEKLFQIQQRLMKQWKF